MERKDTYKTISKASSEVLFKDKNSKFYGIAFPVTSENTIKKYLEDLKKQHYSARHWCYAYQLGTEQIKYRVNDDGEPSNTAGMPIYGQIQSFDLTNVLIVVVRYFGGVKLGVGGLINAYRTAAKLAIEASEIIEKTIDVSFIITCDYKHLSRIMKILNENEADINSQKLELNCELKISVRKGNSEKLFNLVQSFHDINIKKL
ncbi:putative YigZ family protein [Winogradskyella wandonensis]|uniref:Putative YigZ family protein n=1 Tax=Winogradskyella wandonensis TaxID=1442586 RepID=A0A4R1KIW8_9FLAO|nr:YigZ family protein [Winogradskyella wandonensis]TCK64724.1 putative YigZ family protein [Winogradskyella wandonensis]